MDAAERTPEAVEHPGDADAYAVFAEAMGWAATWEQLGPRGRSGFVHAFAAVRAAENRRGDSSQAEHTVRAAEKPDPEKVTAPAEPAPRATRPVADIIAQARRRRH